MIVKKWNNNNCNNHHIFKKNTLCLVTNTMATLYLRKRIPYLTRRPSVAPESTQIIPRITVFQLSCVVPRESGYLHVYVTAGIGCFVFLPLCPWL